jgi:hypothetical protein
MADGSGPRAGGARPWRPGRWIDRILAERAVDIDETYARLEGRPPLSLDDAIERGEQDAARRARRRSEWWEALRGPVRRLRAFRRLRLRLVMALRVLFLLRT